MMKHEYARCRPRSTGGATEIALDSMRGMIVAIGVSVTTLPALAADGTPLMKVKPGLWEITLVGDRGIISIAPEAFAKMSPDERARIGAGNARSPMRIVSQQCMPEDAVERTIDEQINRARTCTYTAVSSTETVREMRVQCHAEETSGSGVYRADVLSSEAYRISFNLTATTGPSRTMRMKQDVQANWLSADCGHFKQ